MIRSIFLGSVLVLLAGCESISDATTRVRDRLEAREESRAKAFAADTRTTFEAVRVAARQMGYRITRAGAAQGILEGVSQIGRGDAVGSSRQVMIRVSVDPAVEGSQVAVRFTEIIEADSSNRAGLATETPLRDTPQYEVFFRAVEEALAKPDTGDRKPDR